MSGEARAPQQERFQVPKAALAGSLAAYALVQLGAPRTIDPPSIEDWPFWICAAIVVLSFVKVLPALARETEKTWHYAKSLRGERVKGAAEWLSAKEAKAAGLTEAAGGMPLGLIDGDPVFAHTETHTLVVGPAGSGKTRYFGIPLLLHRENACLVMDIKDELYKATASARRERMGQNVQFLKPGDPDSAKLNPLDPLREKTRANDPEALILARTYADQLHPEPEEEGQNKHFREGARDVLVALMFSIVSVYGPSRANLAFVYSHLLDRDLLERTLLLSAESDLLNGEVAKLSEYLHDAAFGNGPASKQYEQFRVGAVQSLKSFGPGSVLSEITSSSTVSFKDLSNPDTPQTWYIRTSPNHQAPLSSWVGLLFAQASFELVEAQGGGLVDFVMEEFTNAPVYSLPKILTLLRSFKIRVTMITQELSEISRVFGKQALETIESEASVTVYLSARSPETTKKISERLGEVAVATRSYAMSRNEVSPNASTDKVSLMAADQIRMLPTDRAIAFVHNLKPALVEKVGFDEARPWSREVPPRPREKRFESPWKLRLAYGRRISTQGRSRAARGAEKRSQRLWARVLWFALVRSGALPLAALCAALVWGVDRYGMPQVRVDAGSCAYLGVTGPVQYGGRGCPLITFHRSW